MSIKEYRLGGGLNLTLSEDTIADNQLLQAIGVRFAEPGCLSIDYEDFTIESALLAHSGSRVDMYDSVFGISDVSVDVEGSETRWFILKNWGVWQRAEYPVSFPASLTYNPTPVEIPLTPIVDGTLAAGDNPITYGGASEDWVVPAAGSIECWLWAGGGGGPSGTGVGTANMGGASGFVNCTFAVGAGDILTIYVGGGGEGSHILGTQEYWQGGWPDGGDGVRHSYSSGTYQGAGGGGGSSRIYIDSGGGAALMAICGGGGGGGLKGGAGGGTTGGNSSNSGGTGGSDVAGGVDASEIGDAVKWGGYLEGGLGGSLDTQDAGAGGGGGYYGGGGGGSDLFSARPGGGGSSFTHASATAVTNTAGVLGTATPAGYTDPDYDANAGERAGDPNSYTGYGGARKLGTAGEGNHGGHGYVKVAFTATVPDPPAGTGATNTPDGYDKHRLSAVRYNDKVYVADGYAFRRHYYNSDTNAWVTERVGVTAPAAPTNPVESAGGASVTGVTYRWGVTFWNGTAESNMSDLLEHTATADGKQVTITIPTDIQALTGTISRKIYRSNENGHAMFYVDEVADNSSTSFLDPIGISAWAGDANAAASDDPDDRPNDLSTTSKLIFGKWGSRKKTYRRPDLDAGDVIAQGIFDKDAETREEIYYTNLGLLADWTDHDQPKTDADGVIRNLMVLEDVVYGITDNSTLSFSLLGNAEYWSVYNNVILGRNTGERLMDIKPFDKDVICYTDRGVYRFRRFGVDATESTLERISDIAGCVSEAGVAVTEKQGHIFWSHDGLYQYDGRGVQKMSHLINDIFTDSSNSYYANPVKLESVCGTAKGDIVMFAYTVGAGATGNTHAIVCDLTDGEPKFSVNTYDYMSLHRGWDNQIFGGGSTKNLVATLMPYPTGTGARNVYFKTKLYPTGNAIAGRGMPEKVIIDADLDGSSATVALYGDSYGSSNQIGTWTITDNLNQGRRRYEKHLPYGHWDRIGLYVVMSISTAIKPKFYAVGFYTPGEEEAP